MDSSSVTSSGSSLHPLCASGEISSTLRAVAHTVQPLRDRRSAVAQPMPDEQPVMSTALEVHPDPSSDIKPPSVPCRRPLPAIMPLRASLAPAVDYRRREVDTVEDEDGDVEEGQQD